MSQCKRRRVLLPADAGTTMLRDHCRVQQLFADASVESARQTDLLDYAA